MKLRYGTRFCGTEVMNDGTLFRENWVYVDMRFWMMELSGTQFHGIEMLGRETWKRTTRCGCRRLPLRISGTERSRNCENQPHIQSERHWNLELILRVFEVIECVVDIWSFWILIHDRDPAVVDDNWGQRSAFRRWSQHSNPRPIDSHVPALMIQKM